MTVAALDTYDKWMVNGAPRMVTDLEHALAAEARELRAEIARMKKAERDRKYRDEGYGGHP